MELEHIINIFGNFMYTSVMVSSIIAAVMILTAYKVKKMPVLKNLLLFCLPGLFMITSDLIFFMLRFFPFDQNFLTLIQTGFFYVVYSIGIYTDMYFSHKLLDIRVSRNKKIFFVLLGVIHLLDFPRKLNGGDLWDRDITVVIVLFFFTYLLYLLEKHKSKFKWSLLTTCHKIYRVSTILYIIWSAAGIIVYKLSIENYFYFEIFNMFLITTLVFNGLVIAVMLQLLLKTKTKYTPDELMKFLQKEFDLTGKESELTLLLKDGKNSVDISNQLFVSPQTVKNYTSRLYKKLEVKNKFELIAMIKDIQN